MTPMLEKCARALHQQAIIAGIDRDAKEWGSEQPSIKEVYYALSRALLTVLMEPDEGMVRLACLSNMVNSESVKAIFRAMISSILAGDEEKA